IVSRAKNRASHRRNAGRLVVEETSINQPANSPTIDIQLSNACIFRNAESEGDMNIQCPDCTGLVWKGETTQKNSESCPLKVSICCFKGKITLPYMSEPPTLIRNLFSGVDSRSVNFISNLRSYNNMFAFTSFGGKIETDSNDGRGPPNFVVSGQNYHRIGSLLPKEGDRPKFAQLYIYDTENEVQNRLSHFRHENSRNDLDVSLVEDILKTMDEHNTLVESFRIVRDFYQLNENVPVKLRLFRNRSFDPRIYNVPHISEVAALIIGDFDNSEDGRDIVVRGRDGRLQRIHETHPKYIPLHKIRADFLACVEEAVDRGDIDGSSIGSRVVVPTSFTGVTCNPKWVEIERHLSKSRNYAHFRPDISCRVFHLKLKEMMNDFKKGEFFGKVVAGVYTIEFQKRGLPHAHILLWLDQCNKLESPDSINSVISAELPDECQFPKLYAAVCKFMIHGPCGSGFLSSPCMKDKRCSKFYPKKFVSRTTFDDRGYPIYRRRDFGVTVLKKGVLLDNRSVVPYNPSLIMKYQAHVNIEFCNKSNCIKYLFKYITKGVDRVTAALELDGEEIVDEIKQFYDCRYLSPSESIWRTFGFDIHCRWPGVTRCTFHLRNEQRITFTDGSNLPTVLARNRERNTMFLAWMEANKRYPLGRSLTYTQFPSLFVYDSDARRWHPRKKQQSIGRLTFIPISNPCGALRLLADDREFLDAIDELSILGSGWNFVFKATKSPKSRSEGKIVLNVASSGIASLLLPGGRTAHSQFGIPLVLTEESCCRLDKYGKKAQLLGMASLIIWDEAPMMNRLAFESFERLMRDVMNKVVVGSSRLQFGGKTVVLGGDFRQILPVIPKGGRADIVHAVINSSLLWHRCTVLKLSQNMRLQFSNDIE
ncbi:helicase-like protein, partial [Trifolium medium]|nr:helicase-like protein [Trifolium medium]